MVPKPGVENIILRMTFCADLHPEKPQMTVIKRNYCPTGNGTLVSQWFMRKLLKEKSCHPPNTKVLYTDWTILSGNQEIFTLDRDKFQKVIVILGEESNYWIYYNDSRSMHVKGSGLLMCSYCACCITSKYTNILYAIKEHFDEWKTRQQNTNGGHVVNQRR